MTTPDHSDIPPVSTQVSETEAMNQRIRERGECVWEQVGKFPVLVLSTCNGMRHERFKSAYNFCPYCGKTLVIK